MKIAIIGGGAAGMATAYLLNRKHNITVFEKQPILGGNIRTLNKNVPKDNLPDNTIIDNGVIEFQKDHFVNFHKLMQKLNVPVKDVCGGSSALFLANGRYIQGPGVIQENQFSLPAKIIAYGKLLTTAGSSLRFFRKTRKGAANFKHAAVSRLLNDHSPWEAWMKMLLMYGYSIPYRQIKNFPAELAIPILRQSGLGTRWTRIDGGVYSYIEKILAAFSGKVHVNAEISQIHRQQNGATFSMANGESLEFDKLIIAATPDQVLKLLSDANEDEKRRFSAWKENHATTLIHSDTGFYNRYGVTAFSEFDVFQKDANGNCGYNAFLNRLCGIPENQQPFYSLAYNLTDWIDPEKVVDTQQHQTPLYTADALRYRDEIIASNGGNHTYFAGAWLDNGLHEGAVTSALKVSKLLGGALLP